ncbi:AraC family transcriptional regulator [Cohnella nanjingensis]|uniref:Helix-turn-helix domain-containing protein n=1 Tax=Cohnella nanjingensis TaxID=1387779 RepID=A0A7X0VJ69_9BACL|nr:AraC family transcriptional regulator [Cohnella nanjingensis]MBB6675686.1 helix-turn-helix domain-containing protein [Cohnella nanjingensis]
MDVKPLRENRLHGNPGFPVGFYRIERTAGESILDNHWHEEIEFLMVTYGKAIFQIGLASYELKAGEAIFIPGGELHGGFPLEEAPCTYEAVVCDLGWLIGSGDQMAKRYLLPLQRGLLSLPSHWTADAEWGPKLLTQLRTVLDLEASDDPARELRVKIGLLALFADLISRGLMQSKHPGEPSERRAAERLKNVLLFIEAHFARRLTVRELADVAGMSEGHFSRVFRTYMRQTPIAYLNRYRIRHAAGRLLDSDLTISEAALESGFDNFSYFIKLFRAVYGCTPKAYRNRP